jgi:type I restriction-modification system DNA methylase subunit
VERDNPNLKGKLPRDDARRGIAPEKMKGLIDLIAHIGFKGDRAKARDTLGRVYDPCCGSAGMFVQSERFVEAHGGQKTDISIFGQESNPTTWRLARMNLAIREADLVDCIPACLWFLTRDKTGRNLKHGGRDRKGKTLFIDARKLGTLQTRTLRILTGADNGATTGGDGTGDPLPTSDIGRIVYAFRKWRGEPAPDWWDEAQHGAWAYRDIPCFCKAETIAGIGKHGFVLTPGRYVGAEAQEDDGEPFAEKYPRRLAELDECFREGERLTAVVRERLTGVNRREGSA